MTRWKANTKPVKHQYKKHLHVTASQLGWSCKPLQAWVSALSGHSHSDSTQEVTLRLNFFAFFRNASQWVDDLQTYSTANSFFLRERKSGQTFAIQQKLKTSRFEQNLKCWTHFSFFFLWKNHWNMVGGISKHIWSWMQTALHKTCQNFAIFW